MTPPDETRQIKRARAAGRNVAALALLASIGTVLIFLGVLMSIGEPVVKFMACAFCLIAIGYWTLSVAAKRGAVAALNVILVVYGVQLLLSAITFAIAMRFAPDGTPAASAVCPGVICVLIFVVLLRNRNDMHTVHQLGLAELAFGLPRPTHRTTAVGGALLVVGFLLVYTTGVNEVIRSFNTISRVQEFAKLLNEDEPAIQSLLSEQSPEHAGERLNAAIIALEALERKAKALTRRAEGDEKLRPIVEKYAVAVRLYRDGFESLRSDGVTDAAQNKLQEADRVRMEVSDDFNRAYGPGAPLSNQRSR